MKYRKFGKMGFDVSVLGFGVMRLPVKPGGGDKDIDEAEAIRMIRKGIDSGINYVDTAYIYHGGLSEGLLGKALKDGYRKKVKIADKLPGHIVKEPEDFDRILNEQLKRLDVEHIDCYLFHGIGSGGLKQIQDFDFFTKAEKAIKDGRIGHIGFSFHDNEEAFKLVIDSYDKWEFCQIQMNYMDTENQATIRGLEYAGKNNIPVIIMEPLLGGRLANPPEDVKEVLDSGGRGWSPAEWSFNWLWNRPEIAVVLSGMSTMEQVEQNLASADKAEINMLAEKDMEIIEAAKKQFASREVIPCTQCGYCMPCPQGVDIPGNLYSYNEGIIYNEFSAPQWRYKYQVIDTERADKCTQCEECLPKCPQGIEINRWMPEIHEKLKQE